MSVLDAAKQGNLTQLTNLLGTLPAHEILASDRRRMCCLHHAAKAGHARALQMIISAVEGVVMMDQLDVTASTPLMLACAAGHVDAAELLLGASANADHINSSRHSCLMAAAASGNTSIVQLLLQRNACPDRLDKLGHTALTCAAKRCKLEVVRLLLNQGSAITINADPLHHAVSSVPAGGDSAAMNEMVSLLIAARAGLDKAVHAAAALGHLGAVQQLVEARANLNATGAAADETVLHAAISGGQPVVLEYLLARAPLQLTLRVDSNSETALHRACYSPSVGEVVLNGSMSRVEVEGGVDDQCVDLMLLYTDGTLLQDLINAQDCAGHTALHLASEAGRAHAVRALVAHTDCGVQQMVDAVDSTCTNALMISLRLGNLDICRVLLDARANVNNCGEGTAAHYVMDLVCDISTRVELLELVVAHSVDLSACTALGCTALHLASYHGTDCVKVLLHAKCEPDVRATLAAKRVTPLMLACCHGHDESAQLLLDAKASVTAADTNRWGALHHAASYGVFPNRCVEILIKAGASVDGVGLDHELNDRMFRADWPAATHSKAVAAAVAFHHLVGGPLGVFSDLLEQMLRLGDNTPLVEAVKSSNGQFAEMLLCEFDAVVCTTDGLGNQPIHFAASCADRSMVELLLRQRADITATNLAGCTPLFVSCSSADPDFVQWMVQRTPENAYCAKITFRSFTHTVLEFLVKYGICGIRMFWQGQVPDSVPVHGAQDELRYLNSLQPLLESALQSHDRVISNVS